MRLGIHIGDLRIIKNLKKQGNSVKLRTPRIRGIGYPGKCRCGEAGSSEVSEHLEYREIRNTEGAQNSRELGTRNWEARPIGESACPVKFGIP